MTVHTDISRYYTDCAPRYDRLYQQEERQSDLARLHERLRGEFKGDHVLELGCGTGYWTEDIAQSAAHVTATDLNVSMLEVASNKHANAENITLKVQDAYATQESHAAASYDACFAGGLWSHVPRERQGTLLDLLRDHLVPGARLILLDDIHVEGYSLPIARTDADGNTFQIDRLDNGERYEIMKNFPTDSTLRKRLGGHLKELRIERYGYYWLLTGRFK